MKADAVQSRTIVSVQVCFDWPQTTVYNIRYFNITTKIGFVVVVGCESDCSKLQSAMLGLTRFVYTYFLT